MSRLPTTSSIGYRSTRRRAGDVKSESREYNLPVSIVWLPKDVPERALVCFPHETFKARMHWCRFTNLSKDSSKVSIPIKYEYCGFGVSPAKIREDLIDGFKK